MSEETKSPDIIQRRTVLMGSAMGAVLVRNGIVPPTARRIIIDIHVDKAVIIYVDGFAPESLMDDELVRLLAGKE